MDVPRKERPKQWRVLEISDVAFCLSNPEARCYMCEGGITASEKTNGLCWVELQHRLISTEHLSVFICLRCLQRHCKLPDLRLAECRRNLQRFRNIKALPDLFILMERMPEIAKKHPVVARLMVDYHSRGKSIPPDLCKEALTVLRVYENDEELRSIFAKMPLTHPYFNLFAGVNFKWPCVRLRREMANMGE